MFSAGVNLSGGGKVGGGQVATLAEAQAGTNNSKVITPLLLSSLTSKIFNVKAYGAKGDTQSKGDGAINSGSNLLNSATANFTASDIGKTVEIPGAGAAGAVLVTTITGRNSATQVSVGVIATTTVNNKRIWWGTDDTAAIQAATNACFAAKSKDVYFPIGIYLIAGQLVTVDISGLNPNAQIYIPTSPVSGAAVTLNQQTIRFIGEGYNDLYGNVTNPTGSILKSTLNQGTGIRPSIIGGTGQTVDNIINKMNYTTFILENMMVMASSNGAVTSPNVIGVNGLDLAHIEARHVNVTMDCYLYASTTDTPLGKGSAGIIAGRRDNNGPNILESVWVTGAWERGIVMGEHCYPNYTWCMGCYTAYTFLNGNFEVFGNIGSNTCVNYLEFPNAVLFGEAPGDAFVHLKFAFESSGIGSPPPWLFPTNLLVDAGQNGKGHIKYIAQNGTDLGNFQSASSNVYGLSIVPIGREVTKKFNTAGGGISTGYGTTVAYGDNGTIFEISNPTDAISASNEVTTFIQSNKNNIPNGVIAQRIVMNNTGATGLAGDPNEKRPYLEYILNDGASLNGKRTEYIFTGTLKQITEQTGNLLKWFTNNIERLTINSNGAIINNLFGVSHTFKNTITPAGVFTSDYNFITQILLAADIANGTSVFVKCSFIIHNTGTNVVASKEVAATFMRNGSVYTQIGASQVTVPAHGDAALVALTINLQLDGVPQPTARISGTYTGTLRVIYKIEIAQNS